MRLFALTLALLAACFSAQDQPDSFQGSGSGFGSGSGSGEGPAHQCNVDADCFPAAAKCCDCPTYAVPETDPAHAACNDVVCPMSTCPDNVEAACQQGLCVLACKPMECDMSCADGYAVDSNDCLTCTCAQVAARSCGADTDCVETRADCCGCLRGGADTAVPASQQAAYDASLMCPTDPSCPSVDICDPGVGPRCIQGACELTTPTPAGACGRGDLPSCPTGQICTINADQAATMQGVGVCLPPT